MERDRCTNIHIYVVGMCGCVHMYVYMYRYIGSDTISLCHYVERKHVRVFVCECMCVCDAMGWVRDI